MTTITQEATSKFVQAGDIRVHYHDVGTGDALIMLHGSGPGASGWSNFKQNVGPFSQKFRVLLVDQPGWGKTDKPQMTGSRFGYIARTVKNFMDALGIERAHLVGNSMGGGVALKFALDYPERAGRLVLMGPAGGVSVTSPTPSEGIKVLRTFYAPPGPTIERMRQLINVMLYDASVVSEELLRERFEAAMQPDAMEWYKATFSGPPASGAGAVEELWRDLEKIPHKTLIIWGRDDRVLPLDQALIFLQRLPNVRLHVFGKCGHWAQVEHTDEFNRLVLDFLTLPEG